MPTTDQTNKTGEDTPKLSDAALKGNSGSHSETTPITPITVGEPTDAASLAHAQAVRRRAQGKFRITF